MPAATTKRARRYLPPHTLRRFANVQLVARAVVEGYLSGLHRSPFRGFSVEFAEYREYTPGDDLKHLDWKVYARSDRYTIKQYHEETNLTAYLVVDASGSMGYSASATALSKLEYANYLAAALAFVLQRQGDQIGLVHFGGPERHVLPPRGGESHLQALLGELERPKPAGAGGLAEALHAVAGLSRRRSLVIVLSDALEPPDAVIKGLAHLRHERHDILFFQILDRGELDLPYEGVIDFHDLETGETLLVEPRLLRDAYLEALETFLRAYQRACAAQRIDYHLLATDTPFELALSAVLAKRSRFP